MARARLLVVLFVAALGVAVVGGVYDAVPAAAVHDAGVFELDGNVAQDSVSRPPYDWGSLFSASGQQIVEPDPVNGPLLASVYLSDSALPDQSYFSASGAGVEDIDTLNNWGCGTNSSPLDKNNILNAYAALFVVPRDAPDNAGDQVLYLGAERGSSNGTSFAGFWLLRDPTAHCDAGTGTFDGSHTVGDLLIVGDYTNGGSLQDVAVYKWVGGSNPLTLVASGPVCDQPVSSDAACAIANAGNITSPWNPTSHLANTFVEIGVDLTSLFTAVGHADCFSTIVAETRSSNLLTATLKDFATGTLDTCRQPAITTNATEGGATITPGAVRHDVASVAGAPATPTGTITFTLCTPALVDPAHGCAAGTGTQVGAAIPIVNGSATSPDVSGSTTPNTLATGKYCWRADYTPDSSAAHSYRASSETNTTTECFTVAVRPSDTSPPSISGAGSPSPVTGDRLSATTGAWSGSPPISFVDEWQRCTHTCVNIASATGSSYTASAADVGDHLRVVVTASNSAGSSSAASGLVGPVLAPAGKPSVSRASLSVVGKGHARLAFTLAAGANAPLLNTITIVPPKGLAFARSGPRLAKYIAIRGVGRNRLGFSVRLRGRALTIALKAPARAAQLTISSPGITITRGLAKMFITVTATDTHHTATQERITIHAR